MFDEDAMKWLFRGLFAAGALAGVVIGGVIVWAITRG